MALTQALRTAEGKNALAEVEAFLASMNAVALNMRCASLKATTNLDRVVHALLEDPEPVWLMTCTAFLMVWYRVPVLTFQRALLMGLTVYHLVFSTLLNVARTYGWALRTPLGTLDSVAYLSLLAYWTYTAWRPEEHVEVSPVVLRRLKVDFLLEQGRCGSG